MKTFFDNGCSSSRTTGWLAAISLILLGVLAGCSGGGGKPETIVIRGSNTIGEELAPRLIAEYGKAHSAVIFDTEFKGTPYGLGALMAERCDIAAASREATTNDLRLAADRNIELNDYVIGYYSVAVVVNAASPVKNLTKDQVRDIFAGTIKNWKDVGGPNAAIHLYIRDPISGTYLGFQELAMEKKPYALQPKMFTNYTAIVEAVAKDANGIGYSSIELAQHAGVMGVSIGGAEPSITAVNKGQYPYARVLRLYTDKAKERPAAHEFIQFVQSAAGQQIMDQMGYAPHP